MIFKFYSSHKSVLNHTLRFVFLFAFLNIPFFLFGQQIKVNSKVDTNQIVIGDQFNLTITASGPSANNIVWPALPDTFSNLEVVRRSNIDSVKTSSSELSLTQQIVLTGFDSGYFVIPPLKFYTKGSSDTTQYSETDPLLITVQSVQIDTTKSIRDIKGQVVIPYNWQDFLPYIFGYLLFGVLLYFIIKYFQNRKRKVKPFEKEIPKRPAHEIALEKLKELQDEEIWQSGNYKEYHTRLSDIIRTFIEHRWMENAMEMITDEILELNVVKTQKQEVFDHLKQMLVTSDLVKFAKMVPVVTDNEQCLTYAFEFVNANKVVLEKKEATK